MSTCRNGRKIAIDAAAVNKKTVDKLSMFQWLGELDPLFWELKKVSDTFRHLFQMLKLMIDMAGAEVAVATRPCSLRGPIMLSATYYSP